MKATIIQNLCDVLNHIAAFIHLHHVYITLDIDGNGIILFQKHSQFTFLVYHWQIIDCYVLCLLTVLTLIAMRKNSEISGNYDGEDVFQLMLDMGMVRVTQHQMIRNPMKLIQLAPCVSIESNLYCIVVVLMLKSKGIYDCCV